MIALVKLLAWILLGVAGLCTVCVYMEIRAKKDVYRILEKICLFSLAGLAVLIGIVGLLAR